MTFNSVTPTVIGVRSNLSSFHFPFTFQLLSLSLRRGGFRRNRRGVGMAIKVTTCICGFLSGSIISEMLFNVGTKEVDGWGVRFLIQAFESRIELSFELDLISDINGRFLGIRGFCGSISAESGRTSVHGNLPEFAPSVSMESFVTVGWTQTSQSLGGGPSSLLFMLLERPTNPGPSGESTWPFWRASSTCRRNLRLSMYERTTMMADTEHSKIRVTVFIRQLLRGLSRSKLYLERCIWDRAMRQEHCCIRGDILPTGIKLRRKRFQMQFDPCHPHSSY